MAKVRTKKEHKKRVAKRNNILQQERKKMEKAQKDFLMQLIREEKEKGLFDNQTQEFKLPEPTIPSMGLPITDASSFGIEGPKI
jgi:hypothetical protein